MRSKTPFTDMIEGTKKNLEYEIKEVLKRFEKNKEVSDLLISIRDQEREIALMSLCEKIYLEEIKSKKGGKNEN